ncbi:MAG TPA: LSM domain-containing protein [Candidatus Methanomethylophilaceae archaeon]|nr:LSM domain-containing protein [Candidatus Methanomethylophilaceae archaeon]
MNNALSRQDNMVLPLALLEKSIDKKVVLNLKDGKFIEGKLTSFDEYMNMVLEDASVKDPTGEERRMNSVILRGSNVVSISLV